MESLPLVSIILPTYNRAEWLIRSIGSVISQTYSNWELLVWDDGSSDNTREIISSFNDKRIHYFFQENHGKSYAVNQAIQKANGIYIAFLDDDDQFLNEKLEHQIHAMIINPEIDVIFGDFYNINLSTGEEGRAFEQFQKALAELVVEETQPGLFQITQGFCNGFLISDFIGFDCAIMKKEIFQAVGKFKEDLRNSIDYEFWWRLAIFGYRFGYLKELVMIRNKPPRSLSTTSVYSLQNHLKALDYCLQTCYEKHRYDLQPLLYRRFQWTWQLMIRQSAIENKKGLILKAFLNSWRYGLSRTSIYLLIEAFIGQEIIKKIKNLIGQRQSKHAKTN